MTFASGASKQAVVAYLRGEQAHATVLQPPPQTLAERIRWKAPYPLLRHHFGRPTVDETVAGAVDIARPNAWMCSRSAPIRTPRSISSAPKRWIPNAHGAGGVPVRTEDDLTTIYAHTRLGNYPLMRCYSGTRDTLRWAPMLARTINNAWCAIPLFWYTRLDGRSPRPLREAIPETQTLMRWHAEHGIPVEMNESHHWSLRDAPDVVAVVAAYLAAYNARAAGVAGLRAATHVQQSAQHLAGDGPGQDAGQAGVGRIACKMAASTFGARRAAD